MRDESDAVLRIAFMLDLHLAEHLESVSVIVVKKVSCRTYSDSERHTNRESFSSSFSILLPSTPERQRVSASGIFQEEDIATTMPLPPPSMPCVLHHPQRHVPLFRPAILLPPVHPDDSVLPPHRPVAPPRIRQAILGTTSTLH